MSTGARLASSEGDRAYAQSPDTIPPDATRGIGWIVFAGLLLFIIGTVSVIEGIAAISNANFFDHHTHYVFGSLRTWGWIALFLGAIQLLAAFGVFIKNQLARWVGAGVLAVNGITQLLMMPAYPFWSLCLFAVDVLALYGLVVYGKRIDEVW